MDKEELHAEGLKRFDLAKNHDRLQRELAVKDLLFVNAEDGQWSEDVIEKRGERPRYTIDRISPAINQIEGNQRQIELGSKVVNLGGAQEKTPDIMSGLIRNIKQISVAKNAYDSSFYEMCTCGWGGWRIVTEWDEANPFVQTIKIKPIECAASSLFFDTNAKEYDRRDAQWAFLVTRMDKETFKEKYPEASETDFNSEKFRQTASQNWIEGDDLTIAEYWKKTPIKKKIALLSDGRVIDYEEEKAVLDELKEMEVEVVQTKTIDTHKVKMVIMSGAEILTEPKTWAGKYIPLIPEFGRMITIEGKTYIRGITRKAIDAQQIYNFETSSMVEATANTPKDPYLMTPTQYGKHQKQWQTFNRKNQPVMLYDPDPLAPGVPQRGGAPQVQQAMILQREQAEKDLYATTGIEPPSLGQAPTLKSGVAIQREQSMGDRGAYTYTSNHEKSILHTDEQLLDLIPKIYDTERVVKTLGPDGTEEEVTINDSQFALGEEIVDEQTGKKVVVNDLSIGTFGIVMKSGPSFANKKEETVNQLTSLAANSEVMQELALDLIIKNMDLNNGDEIEARVRKRMIQQGAIEPTEDEKKKLGLDEPKEPAPMDAALVDNLKKQSENVEMQTQKLMADIENKEADTQKKIMETQNQAVESIKTLYESIKMKMESGVPASPEDIELVEGQVALVQESQIDVIEGQQLAGSEQLQTKGQAPMGQPPVMEEDLTQQGPPG